MKKSEENLQDLCNSIKQINIHIMEERREMEKGTESLFNEIVAMNIVAMNLMK